jgi:hypothetical protein
LKGIFLEWHNDINENCNFQNFSIWKLIIFRSILLNAMETDLNQNEYEFTYLDYR